MDFGDDMARLREIVAEDPSFRRVAPARLPAECDRFESTAEDDAEGFALGAMRLLALAGNGHTRAIPNELASLWPLRLVWLADGPCLVDADARYKDLLGGRLLRINDLDPQELHRRFQPFLAGNAARQHSIGAIMLVWPKALLAVTGWPENQPPTLEFELGEQAIRTIRPEPAAKKTCHFYPVHEPGIAGLLIGRNGDAGRYRPGTSNNFCRPWPDSSAWYIRLADFATVDSATVAQDLAAMRTHIMAEPRRSVVVDLRGNPGGDFFGVAELAEGIDDLYRPDGVCLVLVDGFTFSAAIVAAALLKHHASRCCIIGEPMGDDEQFHAEGGTTRLPQSGLMVRHSTDYHDWRDAIPDPDHTPDWLARCQVAAGSLAPDRVVKVSVRDVRSGSDPVVAEAKRALAALG